MTITIALPDDLAERLHSLAAAERMSVEQFAAQALARVAGPVCAPDRWHGQNERRIALIRKHFAGQLTAEERSELQGLQEAADRQLASQGQQMLSDVACLEKAAELVRERVDK